MWHFFSPLENRLAPSSQWRHCHLQSHLCCSLSRTFCAFPVAESVDFDGFRGFITQFSSHWSDCSMEKRYEKIVLNATERVSGANDRNVSWNEMDGENIIRRLERRIMGGFIGQFLCLAGILSFRRTAHDGHCGSESFTWMVTWFTWCHLEGELWYTLIIFDHWNQWQGIHISHIRHIWSFIYDAVHSKNERVGLGRLQVATCGDCNVRPSFFHLFSGSGGGRVVFDQAPCDRPGCINYSLESLLCVSSSNLVISIAWLCSLLSR